MKPVKVAHLTTVDLSLRYLLLAQLDAARERGWEVVGISAPGPDVPWLATRGIRHVALPTSTRGMSLRGDLRAAVDLWRILRRERPDVLHTHNPKPGLYGRVVGRLAGVPVVVNTVHGLYATDDDPVARRLGVYGLEAVASRFSHAELVQNPEDLALLTRWRISAPRTTELLGNGVDLTRFAPGRVTAERRAALRAELGAGDGAVVVGTVGRLVAEKGHPELFAAARSLGPGFRVVVVGGEDPDKPDALSAEALAGARAAGVVLLGHREDVDDLYGAMDVFVLASHREGYPRAAMEAAASGLPVVATDIRGCRQVVEDGVTGLLVPVRDPGALAAAIRELGEDPARRARLGEAARARAEAHFDERHVAEVVLATHERLLADRGVRPAVGPAAPADEDTQRGGDEAPAGATRGPSGRAGARRRPLTAATKRAIDVVGAAAGLVVLSPLMAVVALAVRVRLGRPVLFVQERPGRHGRPFRIYKFRTMRDATGPDGEALPDEQRLTRLGRLLRATSLDELPELWNVLRGDMSLVGPRPLLLEYLDRYSPEQARRHEVRPGLTGRAQVHGRNTTSWDERLALDVWYVDHHTVRLDLRIIALTLARVLRREGISADGHATMPLFEGGAGAAPPAGTDDPPAEPGHAAG